jgi:glycosyltransferase involved in cell wall biosynthesis
MRVVFDTSPAPFTPGGTRTYTEHLADALQIAFSERGDGFALSTLPRWMEPDGTKGLRHKLRVLAWDSYYMHLLLPQRARSVDADLLHTPASRLPLQGTIPTITTIHDVIPLVFPELFRLRERIMLGLYFRAVRHTALHVITVSEQSRNDIHRLLGIDRNRISVTYNGVSSRFKPVILSVIAQKLAHYRIEQPYILSVCTLEPRKNLVRVLQAFARLRHIHKVPHRLVLVGKRGWLEKPIFETARSLGVDEHIQFTGFVPDEDLPALYSGAGVFVYPSLYEGFGIPPLEAMACGCPVVTSSISSLPEVVDDAALLVDPLDAEAIADGILRIIDDRAIHDACQVAGIDRARQFTWSNCAEKTIEVYAQVLGL